MQKSEKGDAIKIFMGIYGVGPKSEWISLLLALVRAESMF